MITGDGRHKLIYGINPKKTELYDLDNDPDEGRDLSASDAKTARKLTQSLVEWIEVGPQ